MNLKTLLLTLITTSTAMAGNFDYDYSEQTLKCKSASQDLVLSFKHERIAGASGFVQKTYDKNGDLEEIINRRVSVVGMQKDTRFTINQRSNPRDMSPPTPGEKVIVLYINTSDLSNKSRFSADMGISTYEDVRALKSKTEVAECSLESSESEAN